MVGGLVVVVGGLLVEGEVCLFDPFYIIYSTRPRDTNQNNHGQIREQVVQRIAYLLSGAREVS